MKKFINIILLVVIAAACAEAKDKAASTPNLEYQIKAAFIYNFLKFTGWPVEKLAESNDIIVGILGDDPFGNLFRDVENKPVIGKKLVIKRLGTFKDLCKETLPCADSNVLAKCHVLFVCKSEKTQFSQIIGAISDKSVLTIGDCDGFIEAGGIINLIPFENKIAFDVSMTAVKKANLKISSQVLRLAKRIIGKESAEENQPTRLAQRQLESDNVYSKLL